jgi:hypothetical protein
MKFIAIAEISGALGLVLPGLLRIRQALTPVAAVGLVTIMAGAVTLMASHGPLGPSLLPLITGILAATVAHGRRGWLAARAPDPRAGAWVASPVLGD